MGKRYLVLYARSGEYGVFDETNHRHISDSNIGGLVAQLKRKQLAGELKDGSIITGESILRDHEGIHGLTPDEHRLFWELYSSRDFSIR